MKVKRLICVEVDNQKTGIAQSNKFYNMTELSDGNFQVEYGRVGKTKIEKIYPMKDWDKILKSKLKKYDDVTDLRIDDDDITADIQLMTGTSAIDDLINQLQSFAGKAVRKSYKISSKKVTEAMVEQAQKILDDLTPLLKKHGKSVDINNKLLELYKTIPRQMGNVKDFLIDELDSDLHLKEAQKLIGGEQDTLDTMAGQVKLLQQTQKQIGTPAQHITILDKMGITVDLVNDNEFKNLKSSMKNKGGQLKKAYKITNKQTQDKFDTCVQNSNNQKTDLYFHGSRNQNWFNIIQSGLLIRPAGSIITGAMFGNGMYFANKAQKAMGYSSVSGSYWAKGNSNKGFIAVYDVHIGKQKHIKKHDSSCYSLNKNTLSRDNFNSVYAHGGIDLINDEFIIYDTAQSTIKYLLELG